jgi:hypothetical protein
MNFSDDVDLHFCEGPEFSISPFQALRIIVRSCSKVKLEVLASVPFLDRLKLDYLVSRTKSRAFSLEMCVPRANKYKCSQFTLHLGNR